MILWVRNSKKPSVAAGCAAKSEGRGQRAGHQSFPATGLNLLAGPVSGYHCQQVTECFFTKCSDACGPSSPSQTLTLKSCHPFMRCDHIGIVFWMHPAKSSLGVQFFLEEKFLKVEEWHLELWGGNKPGSLESYPENYQCGDEERRKSLEPCTGYAKPATHFITLSLEILLKRSEE